MHIDTAELVCRETYATHKPGVGWLAPDDTTGIFDPITEDQMIVKIMRRFSAISEPLAAEMATWAVDPTKLDDAAQEVWEMTRATPEQRLVYWPWKKAQPLRDSSFLLRDNLGAIRGVAFTGDHLDVDPMVLGTPSGVLDLRTGRVLAPEEAVGKLVTKRTAVDPAPPGDTNYAFFEAITSAIPAGQVEYLRWHLARGLVAEMARKAFVHVGSGANGKSMILGLAHSALGQYSVQVDSGALTGNTPDYHKALLRGARMCYMEELETEASVNVAIWKMLAATPTITARPIREAPISFPATWTVHICSNSMPSVDTGDGGAARRASIITWPRKYVRDPRADHERRINIADVAVWGADPANQASMLRWLLDVVNDPEPATPVDLADELDDWKAGNNKVGTFVEDRCVRDPAATVSLASLQGNFAGWLMDNGFKMPNLFTRRKIIRAWVENERGITMRKTEAGQVLTGLRMQPEWFSVRNHAPLLERQPASTPTPPAIAHLDSAWPTEEPGTIDFDPTEE